MLSSIGIRKCGGSATVPIAPSLMPFATQTTNCSTATSTAVWRGPSVGSSAPQNSRAPACGSPSRTDGTSTTTSTTNHRRQRCSKNARKRREGWDVFGAMFARTSSEVRVLPYPTPIRMLRIRRKTNQRARSRQWSMKSSSPSSSRISQARSMKSGSGSSSTRPRTTNASGTDGATSGEGFGTG